MAACTATSAPVRRVDDRVLRRVLVPVRAVRLGSLMRAATDAVRAPGPVPPVIVHLAEPSPVRGPVAPVDRARSRLVRTDRRRRGEPLAHARGHVLVEQPPPVDRARERRTQPRVHRGPRDPDLGRELRRRPQRLHDDVPTGWAPRPRRGVPVRSRLRRTAVCVRPVSSPSSRSDRPTTYCSATNRSNRSRWNTLEPCFTSPRNCGNTSSMGRDGYGTA